MTLPGTSDEIATQPAVGEGVARLRSLLERRPLYIGIETTNICNAACVFCAYPKMRRDHAVMSPELFAKIIRDYVDMGGGAVGLTPIVGDALVDPMLVGRMRLLADTPAVTATSFTTNGIAWRRFSAKDQLFMLERTACVNISIGGLDAVSYRRMFAVDRFEQVRAAIHGMCDMKARHGLPVEIHLMFRVNRPIDELMEDPRMNEWRRDEIASITGINSFGNWGGMVTTDDLPEGAHLVPADTSAPAVRRTKRHACFVYYSNPEITASGIVSACGCMNAEVEALVLGDVSKTHLADIWNGPAFRRLKASFGTDALPDICKQCTYYADGEAFMRHPALAAFEVGDNPWELIRRHASPSASTVLAAALTPLVAARCARIALYGAGAFTRRALAAPDFDVRRFHIVAIIDDNQALQGTRLAEVTVVSAKAAVAMRLDAAVISTDRYVAAMWDAAKPLRDAGIRVVRPGLA
ncbi:MAG: SPASM domain-containing protein [Phycisphaerae bacterium]